MARKQTEARWMVVAGVLLVLAGLTARMIIGARGELSRARTARDQGEVTAQIRHLRRAMAYYLPGNPWTRLAKEELLVTARRAKGRGERSLALHAYRELRSAILALRGIIRPYAESLPEVNRSIAQLTSQSPEASPRLRTTSGRQTLLDRLNRPEEPDPAWAGLGLAGFLLWVTASFLLLLRGLRPEIRIIPGRFWPLLGVIAAGQCLFWLGMAYA
jgi:hypothetical protein